MRRLLNPVLAALAVVSVSAPAFAETVRVDVPVSYGDLDLSRPDHVSILKARLQHAAYVACTNPQISALSPQSDPHACTEDAYQRALAVLVQRIPHQVATRD